MADHLDLVLLAVWEAEPVDFNGKDATSIDLRHGSSLL
jgi:hypothetical protein